MANEEKKDRRSGENRKVEQDRRKEQRRKGSKVEESTPIRRQEDWDKIDDELK